ncbi:MAG: tetratricopeptide repeat protein, partial [Deltaproteobacteria bacterium]|nr:tetratricopeptide repeat protein [Deltaproteobacteria bacterium]
MPRGFRHTAAFPSPGEYSWPWWAAALILALVLGSALAVWYAAAPESLARFYGQTLGPPLKIDSLELAVSGRPRQIPGWGSLKVGPRDQIVITGLKTNRWKNYDLHFYSPQADINRLVRGSGTSLAALLGEEAFDEPQIVAIEIREGDQVWSKFLLESAFTAADFGSRAAGEVELERKISYYRKALAMDPDSAVFAEGLRSALAQAGQRPELIGLLEGDLERTADDPGRLEILARLLGLYREEKDLDREIRTLERLLAASREAEPARKEGLRNNLALLYKTKDPRKAAELYEELASDPQNSDILRRQAYLGELLALYRQAGQTRQEEGVYRRLVPLVSQDQLPGVWSALISLREQLDDKPGQIQAWEELALILPEGRPKANAYKRLGFLWYESQAFDKSEAAYRLSAGLDESDAAVWLNLARLAQAKDDRADYRLLLSRALGAGDTPALRAEQAQAFTDDGLIQEALAAWQSLASLSGSDSETLAIRNRAQTQLVLLHRPPSGELSAEYEKHLYLYSRDSVEFYNLGTAHFKHRNWDSAIEAFARALSLEPENELEGDIRMFLLTLYKEKGQTKDMLAQANWLYPAFPEKKEVRDLLAGQYEQDKNWPELVKAATEWTGQDDEAANWRYLALGQEKTGLA